MLLIQGSCSIHFALGGGLIHFLSTLSLKSNGTIKLYKDVPHISYHLFVDTHHYYEQCVLSYCDNFICDRKWETIFKLFLFSCLCFLLDIIMSMGLQLFIVIIFIVCHAEE